MTQPISVGSGNRAYPVHVAAGALGHLPDLVGEQVASRQFAVISDSNVAPLHGETAAALLAEAGWEASLFTFPAGEASKTRKSWSILTDEILDAGFGRDSCVIAVGGGVTTDLAGFVAATYMRGVPLVQVPTSYLAMIDASVGSKTGVDVRAGKNLVGAFHPPALVVADPTVLTTLPREERAEGLVEAFKHGAILDADYFAELEADLSAALDAEPDAAERIVRRSVELKAGVVSEDEFEGGVRQILNFGHTVGHAIEAGSKLTVGHGSAVASGMVVEAVIGQQFGLTAPDTADRLNTVFSRLLGGLLAPPPTHELRPFLAVDKKVREGRIRCVLLDGIGSVARGPEGWTHEVTEANVIDAIESTL